MYLIGLTGGIASGKTIVTSRLVEHGAVRVDADQLAREVVEPGTDGLDAIRQRFGATVISADGALDRPALAQIIFAEPQARIDLNTITHPRIRALAAARFAEAERADHNAIVVNDVPLLVEASRSGDFHRYDLVVVVNASVETRIDRLVSLRGLTRDEAERRIHSQATDAERLEIADVVIDSNGTLEQTLEQADALWEQVSRRITRRHPERQRP